MRIRVSGSLGGVAGGSWGGSRGVPEGHPGAGQLDFPDFPGIDPGPKMSIWQSKTYLDLKENGLRRLPVFPAPQEIARARVFRAREKLRAHDCDFKNSGWPGWVARGGSRSPGYIYIYIYIEREREKEREREREREKCIYIYIYIYIYISSPSWPPSYLFEEHSSTVQQITTTGY